RFSDLVPEVGLKDAIFGKTVNDEVLVAVPAGVVTDIGPLVAVLGTVALIELRDVIVKDDASTPPNFTEVVPIKPLPLIYTCVPDVPEIGVNDVIFGKTVKLVALVPVPAVVVTDIGPVSAVLGTVALIEVADSTVKDAACPLNFTEVAPIKPLPLIVTIVPAVPEAGLKDVIFVKTVNDEVLVAVPSGVVTVIGPLAAVLGTVALI